MTSFSTPITVRLDSKTLRLLDFIVRVARDESGDDSLGRMEAIREICIPLVAKTFHAKFGDNYGSPNDTPGDSPSLRADEAANSDGLASSETDTSDTDT